MKIERKNIDIIKKALNQIKDFEAPEGDYQIVFPIDAQTKSIGGIELTVSNNASGMEKLPEPGILFDGETSMVFVDYQFARKVDFLDMMDLIGFDLSKKLKETLSNLDCFFVHKQNIIAKF